MSDENSEYLQTDDSDMDKDYYPSGSDSGSDDGSQQRDINKNNVEDENASCVKKKGKKRLRYRQLDKKEIRKKKRNSGKEYYGYKNKFHRARVLQQYEHSCRYQCTKITENERQKIFNKYWDLGDWNLQTAFISSCVTIQEPKRKILEAINAKNKSIIITLKNFRVCKMFFLKTLDISNGQYSRAVDKKSKLGFSTVDTRGKAPCPNKVSDEAINVVKQHIDLFPKYVSHYTRRYNPNKKYLPSYLTIKKMYECYLDYCSENDLAPVKEWCYRRIFNTDFNLSFHHPLSDTCNKCDEFKMLLKACKSNEEQHDIETQRDLHHRKAEKAVDAKRKAKALAMESQNDEVVAICFDLQKTLPTPSLTTNKVFYMRVLWTYNLGIHNLGKKCASMFMWNESVASRGSLEVGSCLVKFISSLPANTKHLIAFSDSCSGQNKNKNIVKFFIYLVRETQIDIIDHKFLEPGHTYMECDEDFGIIEKHKKHTQYVYIPEEWTDVVKKSSRRFTCYEMQRDDFVSLENLDEYIVKDIKKDAEGCPIKWRDIKWVRIEKASPFIMQFKYTLNEDIDFFTVDCDKHSPGRKPQHISLSSLYSNPICINYKKWKNLQDLLSYIPPVYHDYYKSLRSTSAPAKKGKQKKPQAHQVEDSDESDALLLSDDE